MDENLKDVNLIEELDDTFFDLEEQLIGDTWKERGMVWNGMTQEARFFFKMHEYYEDFMKEGVSMPWTKILGEAHICLVREKALKESE